MQSVVFYSWQSDLPNRTNRSFIQTALEKVADAIRADDSIEVEPVVDRDTSGIAGSPDIAKTIFGKIETAAIFVADISLINTAQQGRKSPNPNVLLELGYALHALGDHRVILVFNKAHGNLEDLPFDVRMRRVMTYNMPESAQERSTERKVLESKLDDAIRAALGNMRAPTDAGLTTQALEATENLSPNRVLVLRRFTAEINQRIQARRPKPVTEWNGAQDLLDAIEATIDIVADFTRVSATVATMADNEAATELHRGFGPLLEACDRPEGFSGTFYPADYDFFKFLTHELYATLFAALVRDARWTIVSNLLSQGIPVNYSHRQNGPAYSPFGDMSQPPVGFGQLDAKRRRLSVQADVLKTRHDTDPLRVLMPFREFIDTDYFLYLRCELSPSDVPSAFQEWRPWSTVFMRHVPRFILDARSAAAAQALAAALGLPDVEALKAGLHQIGPRLKAIWRNAWWDHPVTAAIIDQIGTSP